MRKILVWKNRKRNTEFSLKIVEKPEKLCKKQKNCIKPNRTHAFCECVNVKVWEIPLFSFTAAFFGVCLSCFIFFLFSILYFLFAWFSILSRTILRFSFNFFGTFILFGSLFVTSVLWGHWDYLYVVTVYYLHHPL